MNDQGGKNYVTLRDKVISIFTNMQSTQNSQDRIHQIETIGYKQHLETVFVCLT